MKSTPGIISTAGIVPITAFCDVAGPLTKSTRDLAILLDILVDPLKTAIPKGGYESAVTGSWDGLKIGTLDPETWTFPAVARKPEPAAEAQMVSQYVRVRTTAGPY